MSAQKCLPALIKFKNSLGKILKIDTKQWYNVVIKRQNFFWGGWDNFVSMDKATYPHNTGQLVPRNACFGTDEGVSKKCDIG